ncbi:hypothetical protein SCP_0902940 [Sparassis crispa]|uniref:Uncharacterized protein n=1 Tax=Sparassis crispa TaxID=139825 RepID=A0A401GW25_9APHY|nr:hypothetical protein SCP_0902940 [Sparassis crispa]GBE86415.1 hypothetical protein SCP_0902940 [Sparassis crispa]
MPSSSSSSSFVSPPPSPPKPMQLKGVRNRVVSKLRHPFRRTSKSGLHDIPDTATLDARLRDPLLVNVVRDVEPVPITIPVSPKSKASTDSMAASIKRGSSDDGSVASHPLSDSRHSETTSATSGHLEDSINSESPQEGLTTALSSIGEVTSSSYVSAQDGFATPSAEVYPFPVATPLVAVGSQYDDFLDIEPASEHAEEPVATLDFQFPPTAAAAIGEGILEVPPAAAELEVPAPFLILVDEPEQPRPEPEAEEDVEEEVHGLSVTEPDVAEEVTLAPLGAVEEGSAQSAADDEPAHAEPPDEAGVSIAQPLADEEVALVEPVTVDDEVAPVEPVAVDEEVALVEPIVVDDEAAVVESVAVGDGTALVEPVAVNDEAALIEPVAVDDEAALVEAVAAHDEAIVAHSPVEGEVALAKSSFEDEVALVELISVEDGVTVAHPPAEAEVELGQSSSDDEIALAKTVYVEDEVAVVHPLDDEIALAQLSADNEAVLAHLSADETILAQPPPAAEEVTVVSSAVDEVALPSVDDEDVFASPPAEDIEVAQPPAEDEDEVAQSSAEDEVVSAEDEVATVQPPADDDIALTQSPADDEVALQPPADDEVALQPPADDEVALVQIPADDKSALEQDPSSPDSATSMPLPSPNMNKEVPPPPPAESDEEDEEEAPELYLSSLTIPTMFLPIPNTDPLTTLLTKYISPEKRPVRDITGEWQRNDFNTLVMTNSWRALARMARDRIVEADPEDLSLILSLWSLRLSCLARLRLFNQTSAECTNLFTVLNAVEPAVSRVWLFDRVLPFELEVLHAKIKYWMGDHMGYLDALAALLRRCKAKARHAKVDDAMWKERGARVCLIIASQLIEMKDFSAAAKLLEPLCKQGPDTCSPQLESAVGRIYVQSGYLSMAAKHFTAVARNPASELSLKATNAALLASAEGNWTKAAEELRLLLASDPENYAAANNLSVALLCQGKIQEGIRMLEEVLRASPSTIVVAEPLIFNLSTMYELRSTVGVDKKRDLLVEVAKWAGDGVRTACLKMPST